MKNDNFDQVKFDQVIICPTEALRLGRLGYGNKTTYIIYFEPSMALLGQFKANLKKGHDC